LVDDTRTFRHDRRARIAGNNFFDACANSGASALQKWNSLTLHVRAHQGAVRVVVFKERDQRGRNRHSCFGETSIITMFSLEDNV